ncbi:hypothetical protein, partial [Clavibacter michiganensis]|uniref:hypothetical protein n=1 Tax=Clavibacter michiganensis TaxID=28447 RepID=UPI001B804013
MSNSSADAVAPLREKLTHGIVTVAFLCIFAFVSGLIDGYREVVGTSQDAILDPATGALAVLPGLAVFTATRYTRHRNMGALIHGAVLGVAIAAAYLATASPLWTVAILAGNVLPMALRS